MSSTTPESLNIFKKPAFHRMIQAVAGAGKTTDLIFTFISFCEEFHKIHNRFPKVVLCTFTRKATLEIRERINKQLLAENKIDLYFHVQKKNHVLISTIHGVFYQFLQHTFKHQRQTHHQFNFDPQIQLKSSQDFFSFKRNLLRKIIFSSKENSVLLEHFKFQHIFESAEALMSSTILNPEIFKKQDILLEVAQSIKSFQNTCREVDRLLSRFEQEKWKILCAELKTLAQIPILTENDCQFFFSQIQRFKLNVKSKPQMARKEPELEGIDRDIYNQVFASRDLMLKNPIYQGMHWDTIENLNQTYLQVFKSWVNFFRDHQIATSAISFQDLEFYVLQLLKNDESTGEHFVQQWDYWMIDEYQDTSPLQNFVLDHLTKGKPQFVVGDPQQSIYYFRGADQTLFGIKKNQMTALDAKFELKNKNHRSHPGLIASFNHFFGNRQTQTEFTLMSAYLDRQGSYHLQSPRTQLLVCEKSENFDDSELALFRCVELLQQGVDLKDICVLSKNNSHLQKFTKLANQWKIPVQLYSSRGFTEKREVMDLIAYLKFLLNPHDDLNLLVLLRSPYVGMMDQDIFQLCQISREANQSLFDAIKESLQKTAAKFIIDDLNRAGGASLISMAYEYVLRQGMIHAANQNDLSHQTHSNLFKVIDLMEIYLRTQNGYWFDFFDQLENSNNSDQELGVATPTLSSSRVHAMTIHSAKGLEFNHVILLGCDRKSFFSKTEVILFDEKNQKISLTLKNQNQENLVPLSLKSNLDSTKESEKAELERTFYVAITRAKETLTLCGKRQKTWDANCYFQFALQELSTLPQEQTEKIEIVQNNPNFILRFFPRNPLTDGISLEQSKTNLKIQINSKSQITPLNPLSPESSRSSEDSKTISSPSKSTKLTLALELKNLLAAQSGTQLHRYLQSLQNYARQSTEAIQIEKWITLHESSFAELRSGKKGFREMIQYLWNQQEIPFEKILKNGFSEWSYEYT
ncbi:MAG: UvrD-helicase domain-containing protein, partial [Pseudobdellovibrionaceae bacterium]